jgi:8-oxo-dGTP diphosphatase
VTKPEVVNAAVAVLLRDDGHVLLAERPAGKSWAGWWEFPGGKIESGETPFAALQRELDEELGTQASLVYPWLTRSFAYPERTVKLHFFIVRQWTATPHGREGQQLSWQNPAALTLTPLLPANVPLLAALQLPNIYAITDLAELGERVFFMRLQQALERGLRLLQVREKHLPHAELKAFSARVIELTKPYGARVLINTDIQLARELNADGVHLPASTLMRLTEKPQDLLCAASCHSRSEMDKAAALELDFVLLSPILPTQSHANAITLGWPKFSSLATDFPLPIYALGGLQSDDLNVAWQHGAHGIAMQRGAWR